MPVLFELTETGYMHEARDEVMGLRHVAITPRHEVMMQGAFGWFVHVSTSNLRRRTVSWRDSY